MKAGIPLLVFALGGCVSSNGLAPGDINVTWAFSDGSTCGTLGSTAATIQIDIPGQALPNGGAFPCDVQGEQAVVLDDFDPGSYDITVTALDPSGTVTYTWSGSLVVNGDVEADANLTPVQAPLAEGNITFIWSFSDNNTCASLGGSVSDINVQIPGQTLAQSDFPCETAGTQGIELDDFAGGSYTFSIDALSPSGAVLYSASGPFEVNGNTNVDVTLSP